HAADPVELGRIELGLCRAEQRIESSAASDHAERAAVFGRDIVEPVGEHETASARHVLRYNRRIAGDEATHVARERPSINVISSACTVADVKFNPLALVEARGILCVRVRHVAERQNRGGAGCGHKAHVILLCAWVSAPYRTDVAPTDLFGPGRSDPQSHGTLFDRKARFETHNMKARARSAGKRVSERLQMGVSSGRSVMAIKYGRAIEARLTPIEAKTKRRPGLDPTKRPRRNRKDEWARRLVREHELNTHDLIWPLFLVDGVKTRVPVDSMPGVERLSVDEAVREAERAADLAIP